MYICKHFAIQELVGPDLFNETDDPDLLWWLFDDRLLRVADQLREAYGPMTVNDWLWGGGYTDSGFRTPESGYYSITSQHSHGRALDLKPSDVSVERIRRDIVERKRDYLKAVTGLELGVSWLHIDVRNTGGKLHTFRP